MHIRQLVAITALIGALLTISRVTAAPEREAILEGRAVLPAQTFAPGPPSGTLLGSTPINGVTVPFASQPVQGVSAVLDAGDGSFWIMEDNGYGAKNNSADFLIRMYRVRPDFETARGGSGTVAVDTFIQLRDPDHRVPCAIVQDGTAERLLSGADFDIESVRRDRNGELWFGDEFGPFLLHTDATGRLLEAPIPLPGVQSPDNPMPPQRASTGSAPPIWRPSRPSTTRPPATVIMDGCSWTARRAAPPGGRGVMSSPRARATS